MKKLTTLTLLFLTGTIISLSSCGSKNTQASILQAFFGGTQHTFNSANGMYVYQNYGYSTVVGTESGTGNNLNLYYTGTNTGNYGLGAGYTNSLSLTMGTKTYSSTNYGSHGSINITKLDAPSMVLTGNFNGTLMSSTPGDSLPISSGLISVKYQF